MYFLSFLSFLMCFPLNSVTEVLCKCSSCSRESSFKASVWNMYSLAVLVLVYPLWVFLGSELAFPSDEYLVNS